MRLPLPLRWLSALGALAALAGPALLGCEATNLRCEYLREPTGIDTPQLRLSWEITGEGRSLCQTAWQIRAASSPGRQLPGFDNSSWSAAQPIARAAGVTMRSRESGLVILRTESGTYRFLVCPRQP